MFAVDIGYLYDRLDVQHDTRTGFVLRDSYDTSCSFRDGIATNDNTIPDNIDLESGIYPKSIMIDENIYEYISSLLPTDAEIVIVVDRSDIVFDTLSSLTSYKHYLGSSIDSYRRYLGSSTTKMDIYTLKYRVFTANLKSFQYIESDETCEISSTLPRFVKIRMTDIQSTCNTYDNMYGNQCSIQ